MDDATVIRKCIDGDPEMFRVLVERYQKQAVGHAMAILGNREDALDAVQEAFIDVFRALYMFDANRQFYPWFYVLLRNRCFKVASRRPKTVSIEEMDILAPQSGLSADEKFALEGALFSLSAQDREILTLKYLDGLSYEELGDRLEIPRGTVMSRLFHARKKIQAKMTANLGKHT